MKQYVIGVDLGGTNTVFGVVDATGNIILEGSIKTGKYKSAAEFVNAGVKCINEIVEPIGGIDNIQGIGIGAPNANYYSGTIEFAPNIKWAHNGIVPLAEMFIRELGVPVRMTNDANAAAMGEKLYGVAKGMKNFIMLTLGTGVGAGIIVNGELVYGHDGFAGELGHICIDRSEDARQCGCGLRGCLETYCSATENFFRRLHVLRVCATNPPIKSNHSMYILQPKKAMKSQKRYSSSPVPYSDGHVPILQLFQVLKPSFSLADSASRVTS